MRAAAPVVEPLTREGAARAALHELAKGIYATQRPTLGQRLLDRLVQFLGDALQRATAAAPGGGWGLLALLALLVAAIVAIRLRTGPLARATRSRLEVGLGATVSAEEHRRRADAHAAAGRYAEAVRERLRALAADLERRAVIEPRPARTADEMAAEAGAVLTDIAADLRRAARTFDDVWYGGRTATADMDAELRAVDGRVQESHPGAAKPASVPALRG